MSHLTYTERRGQIETYFDRTAVQAWARLTSDAPVGRVRAYAALHWPVGPLTRKLQTIARVLLDA